MTNDLSLPKTAFQRICLATAVEVEFKAAMSLLSETVFAKDSHISLCRGRFSEKEVVVLKSEIGAIGFADKLSAHLAHHQYDALIVVGLAGGLDPALKTGHSVVYEACYDGRINEILSNFKEMAPSREEKASIRCDPALTRFVSEVLRDSDSGSGIGVGVTVDRIVTEAEEKVALGRLYMAHAVDMESYDTLAVCSERGLPATAVRVISDGASYDIPDFNRAYKPDGRVDAKLMAASMLARPAGSIRFLSNVRSVINSLKFSLKAILSA